LPQLVICSKRALARANSELRKAEVFIYRSISHEITPLLKGLQHAMGGQGTTAV
jgi:hypothetical protein